MSVDADKGVPRKSSAVKVTRCTFYWRCFSLIPEWRALCWKCECEMREGWPAV